MSVYRLNLLLALPQYCCYYSTLTAFSLLWEKKVFYSHSLQQRAVSNRLHSRGVTWLYQDRIDDEARTADKEMYKVYALSPP